MFRAINQKRLTQNRKPLFSQNFCWEVERLLEKDEEIIAAANKVGMQLTHKKKETTTIEKDTSDSK